MLKKILIKLGLLIVITIGLNFIYNFTFYLVGDVLRGCNDGHFYFEHQIKIKIVFINKSNQNF